MQVSNSRIVSPRILQITDNNIDNNGNISTTETLTMTELSEVAEISEVADSVPNAADVFNQDQSTSQLDEETTEESELNRRGDFQCIISQDQEDIEMSCQ